jgi:hypothetical protein
MELSKTQATTFASEAITSFREFIPLGMNVESPN